MSSYNWLAEKQPRQTLIGIEWVETLQMSDWIYQNQWSRRDFWLWSLLLFFSETKHNSGGSLTQILQRNNDVVAVNKEHRDFRHHHLDEKKQFFRFGMMASMGPLFCFTPRRISGLSPWENTSWNESRRQMGAHKIPSCGATVNCELSLRASSRRHLPYWLNRNRTLAVWLKMHVSHKSLR